ncbi:hypothetical protein KKE34_01595 [Patescibacteria group bacterium]|nr:hypothetical protein [Patescibacteria group bacterium]MBU1885282.1 hypothetical protein [Patescibacteria group bacterium]
MALFPTNTRKLKKLKTQLKLSHKQKELLIGTILGDGCLITSRSGKAARLQIRHTMRAKEYVEWKYSFFKDWVLTPPREDIHNNSWYFRTVSHKDLMIIKNHFYTHDGVKIIPSYINELLISPLSLAAWFMDDGNGYNHFPGLRISTYAFKLYGNVVLKNCLLKNFGLKTNLLRDSKGYQLLFPVRSARRLHKLMQPYIVPCMSYKLATLTP